MTTNNRRIRVYPYKKGSKSAKKLSLLLGGKVLRREGSNFVPRPSDVIINWGSTTLTLALSLNVLNRGLSSAQNKLTAFQLLEQTEVSIPPFWTDVEDIPEDAYPIVCRTTLTGHSGQGIVIANNVDELVPAPLYTEYIKKQQEYRIHVLAGEVIFCQRKARKLDVEEPNWKIRNLAGGFVFVEVDEDQVPSKVILNAVEAIRELGLDFGGCDVVWNAHHEQAYVLEVNTACGLEDRTAEKYANKFKELINDMP